MESVNLHQSIARAIRHSDKDAARVVVRYIMEDGMEPDPFNPGALRPHARLRIDDTASHHVRSGYYYISRPDRCALHIHRFDLEDIVLRIEFDQSSFEVTEIFHVTHRDTRICLGFTTIVYRDYHEKDNPDVTVDIKLLLNEPTEKDLESFHEFGPIVLAIGVALVCSAYFVCSLLNDIGLW